MTFFTRRDYEALPEGFPAQLVDGFLVREPSPSYGHQLVQMDIVLVLAQLVGRGRLIVAPADVLVDELNVFQPDIVVLRETPRRLDSSYVGTPLLAVEILSLSSAERDRTFKTRRLLGKGVEEVWLVDPSTRSIDVVRVDAHDRALGSNAVRSRALPGFQLIPDELFVRPE